MTTKTNEKQIIEECLHWNITQEINLKEYSTPQMIVKAKENYCTKSMVKDFEMQIPYFNTVFYINLIVLILSSISLYLSYKYFYEFIYVYLDLKEKYKSNMNVLSSTSDIYGNITVKNSQFLPVYYFGNKGLEVYRNYSRKTKILNTGDFASSEKLNEKQKLSKKLLKHPYRLLNLWNIFSILGNTIQLFGSIMSLYEPKDDLSFKNILVGLGCFCAWINIVKYLQYSKHYFLLFATLYRAAPIAGRYLLGIMPIFLGFGFFASSIFYKSSRFYSFSGSLFSQFALLNGDMIFDAFKDLTGISKFAANCYLYCFIILFMYGVQNLFISIVQNYFSEVKKESEKEKELKKLKKLETKKKLEREIIFPEKNVKAEEVKIQLGEEDVEKFISKSRNSIINLHNQITEIFTSMKENYKRTIKVCPKEKELQIRNEYKTLLNDLITSFENEFNNQP